MLDVGDTRYYAIGATTCLFLFQPPLSPCSALLHTQKGDGANVAPAVRHSLPTIFETLSHVPKAHQAADTCTPYRGWLKQPVGRRKAGCINAPREKRGCHQCRLSVDSVSQ